MSVRTIQLFHDVHMGLGHQGLASMARQVAEIDVQTLEPGNILMFLNKRMDKLKVLGAHGVVVGYLKMPKGHRIDLAAIQFIPQALGAGGSINYPAALKRSLEQRLKA